MSELQAPAKVAVIGAGTMGHGIAQVCGLAGFQVSLIDDNPEAQARGLTAIRGHLDKGVERGKVSAADREAALQRIHGAGFEEGCAGAALVIEAVPERLDLKRRLLREAAALAAEGCVLATNTSSLSISRIAKGIPDPGRVIGTHFFNPVHIMALLEVVVGEETRPEITGRIQDFGKTLGKEVITVRDAPGFATSRLGVCLGMEAIRMVEQGVASPEDIDKAMVLGYRHPIGPLKLTDLIGLDVRLQIGEYLAKELNNPAFSPPALLKEKVQSGHLGKKTGQGFYTW